MSLAVQPTGPADMRDQRWLDERIATARNGIEAVIDIALNWTEGRQVGRLHPGTAPAEYVREHVGLLSGDAIVPLLTETNWSNRQIAAVTGVDEGTVRNRLRNIPQSARPERTLGADGFERPAFRPRLDPTPYFATPAEEDANELDLTNVPTAAADAAAQWYRDLHRYASGFEHVAPPPRIDPAKYRRERRRLMAGVRDLIDQLARDD